ncbi:hypothetical protein BGZ60DRAFT_407206 [Tricladium varicosporioides]|nr:hypothetical protein BGZ60DRAFT_407206 [Hymenoscyphus varicosporioides]
MAEYVVFGHWYPQAGKEDELIAAFQPILTAARSQIDTVPCLYLLQEDKESPENEILTITCYKNEEISKGFTNGDVFSSVKTKLEEESLLRAPPKFETPTLQTGYTHRTTVDTSPDPFIVVGRILYEPGTISEGVKHWSDVTSFVNQNEKETLTYCFLNAGKDEKSGKEVLLSFERYKDKEYFSEIHCKSEAIKTNIACQKDIRTPGGLSHRFWKQIGSSRLA